MSDGDAGAPDVVRVSPQAGRLVGRCCPAILGHDVHDLAEPANLMDQGCVKNGAVLDQGLQLRSIKPLHNMLGGHDTDGNWLVLGR